MKIRSGSIYSLIALMVIMVVVIILTISMQNFKSELLPLTFSVLILILAGIRLRKEILFAGKRTETTESDDDVIVEQAAVGVWRAYFIAMAWVFGFVLAAYLFGFIPAMALVTILYTRTHGVSWLTSILFTILTPGIIWLAFELALQVTLYRGLIYRLLGY